jgi:RND family efflux transporter MFP subunit
MDRKANMIRLPKVLMTSLVVLLIAACSEPPPPAAEEVARPAKLFTVVGAGAAVIRAFPGEVRATDEAEMAFRVPGELIEFPGNRGMQVKQGQLLARLDPADYQAALDQAQAQFDLAKAQFNRAAELIDRQLIAQAEYDQRLAMMKVRQSNLTRAQNDLDYTRLIAPFDGIIARRLAENFESVAAGQVVLVLQTGDMIDITVDIPESIILRLERTEARNDPPPVQARFDSFSNETFDAHYKEHESQADPATLTYKVTFSMPNPEGVNVLPGMSATILADLSKIYEKEAEGIAVPIESVFSAEDEPLESDHRSVWKVDPDSMRATRLAVRVGALSGSEVTVLEGLSAGDVIVAAGVNAVHEGMLLRTMEREGGL